MASPELVRAYEAQSETIRRKVLVYVMAVWDSSTAFRDEDVSQIVATIVPAVQAGQLQMAALTDAYIGQVAREAGVSWVPRVDRSVVGYRGVPVSEVYRRPAVEVYTALASGASFTDAKARGGRRLQSVASTDLQQARNRQASVSIEGSGFQQYRRVLTGNEDCALCAIASTHTYNRGDLMPMHPGCDCGVEPITDAEEFRAGALADLEQFHGDVVERLGSSDASARDLGLGKTSASGRPLSDYTDLIISREHGEYGPTLSWRSHDFTSAADIPAL